MSAHHTLMRAYEAARDAVYAHCGYVEDWRSFPLSDATDQHWAVDAGERERLSWDNHLMVADRRVRIADGFQCLSPECGGTKNLRLAPAEGGSS